MNVNEMSLEELEAVVNGWPSTVKTEWVPVAPKDGGDEPDWELRPMTAKCWECGGFDGESFVERGVVSEFTCNAADPTRAYVLTCGHKTID
jgi:hypothetical protein